MIEFVFSASPETIRNEPPGVLPLRPVGKRRDLADCAFLYPMFLLFHYQEKVLTQPLFG
jgi:hypothetical protein